MPTTPPPAIAQQAHPREMRESEIAQAHAICTRAEREGRLMHFIITDPTIDENGNLTSTYHVVSRREAIEHCIQSELDGDGELELHGK